MVIKKNNVLELQKLSVRYINDGVEIEAEVGEEGTGWWIELEEKWDNISSVVFFETEYTEDQIKRFEEIKNMDINENVANEYVLDGTIGSGLEVMTMQKENQELKQLLADLTETMLMGGL